MDVWPVSWSSQRIIKDQRDRFLSKQVLTPRGVRPLIRESWARSLQNKVDPSRIQASICSRTSFETNFLFRVVELGDGDSLVQEIRNISEVSGNLVVLADEHGIIRLVEGPSKLRQAAEEFLHLKEGTCWSEETLGTNALGTTLTTGQTVQVLGAEHYCEAAHGWACVAAPIRHPSTRRILGAVDMTGFLRSIHPHSMTAVSAAARAIEALLERRISNERYVLLDQFSEVLMKNRATYLVTVDQTGTVLKATPGVHEENLTESLDPMTYLPNESEYSWEVERGGRMWRCHFRPCYDNGSFIGGLVQFEPPKTDVEVRIVPRHNGTADRPTVRYGMASILGDSERMTRAKVLAARYAGNDLPVLIHGETGTGKELFAQAIHSHSRRRNQPFVAVNCSAIPRDLAVSELFGYVRGAFTGAEKQGSKGKFRQAHRGTLFLDEIADMPLELQPLLLRVLEEGEVTPLGAPHAIQVDVRVIAASHQNLRTAVEQGRFREDLYYRLSVLTLDVPALRERADDVRLLAGSFLRQAALELGTSVPELESEAWNALCTYSWPGNVRQLRNVMFRLMVQHTGRKICLGDLPEEIRVRTCQNEETDAALPGGTLHEWELQSIMNMLAQTRNNVSEAARRLGISRSTIYRKLKQFTQS